LQHSLFWVFAAGCPVVASVARASAVIVTLAGSDLRELPQHEPDMIDLHNFIGISYSTIHMDVHCDKSRIVTPGQQRQQTLANRS
jgi:hypothetical protein